MFETPRCPAATELEQFLLGKLPEAESVQIEKHLVRCEACQQVASGLEATDNLVDTVQQRPDPWWQDDSDQLEALIGRLLCLPKSAAAARDPASSGKPDFWQSLMDLLGPAEQPGELGRLGRYRILRLLGAGGMGVVFEAEDTQSQQRVAVKVLSPALVDDPSAIERFVHEAHAMAEIVDDHVLPSLDVGQERGVPYLVMPLLRGETLRKRLTREGVLPVTEILRIGREMAAGLAAAHERGLLHGDIKPRNVWLEAESDHVRLLDFGLARALRDVAGGGPAELAGTPPYMAPEHGRGQPVDHRADLFSLGCVLYEMCTGQTPFQGETAVGVLMAAAADTPKSPLVLNPTLPRSLSFLILKLLAKDPDKRLSSAKAVIHELECIERGQAKSHPSRRWFVVTSLAAVLLISVTAAICFRRGGTPFFRSTRTRDTQAAVISPGGKNVPAPAPVLQSTSQPGGIFFKSWPRVYGVHLELDENGGASADGRIAESSQTDWYEFTATRTGAVTVTVAGVDDQLIAYVSTYRSAGGGIDSHVGDQTGQATVTFRVEEDERIIVAARSHNKKSTGKYRLTVVLLDGGQSP